MWRMGGMLLTYLHIPVQHVEKNQFGGRPSFCFRSKYKSKRSYNIGVYIAKHGGCQGMDRKQHVNSNNRLSVLIYIHFSRDRGG